MGLIALTLYNKKLRFFWRETGLLRLFIGAEVPNPVHLLVVVNPDMISEPTKGRVWPGRLALLCRPKGRSRPTAKAAVDTF
jgi:hypothetical protein